MARTLLVAIALLVSTTLHAASGPIYKNVRVFGASAGAPEVATDGYRHKLADSYKLGLNNVTPIQILSADSALSPITLSLGYRSGTSPETVTPLFGGNGVSTNDSTNGVMAGTGGTFVFIANTLSTSVRSDSTAQAIVLTAGHNLEQMAASKGLQSSTSARGLPSSLATYVDEDTCDTTPSLLPNDAIVMFELDSTDPESPEYDFADLIVLVNFQTLVTSSDIGLAPLGTGDGYICGATAQPYIRDSIGPDSSATDGTEGFTSMTFPGLFLSLITFEVPSGQGGEISSLDVVAGSAFGGCSGGSVCYGEMNFTLLGWNNQSEVSTNPATGSLFNIDVTQSYSVIQEFGMTNDGGNSSIWFPTSLLQFQLASAGAFCPASGCVFGLLADVSQAASSFEISTSTLSGPIDWGHCSGCTGAPAETMGVRFEVSP